jgi:putative aldouronate transport system substrate-binding protein
MTPIQFDNGGEIIIVNRNAEHPEAVIKLINLYLHIVNDAYPDEMDIEELNAFNLGDMQHLPTFRVNNPLGEYQQMVEVQNVLANNRDTSLFTIPVAHSKFTNALLWIDYQDPDGMGGAFQLTLPYSAYVLAAPIFRNDWFARCRMWGPAPDAHLRLGGTLQSMLVEGYTQIIMGLQPIEYFDQLAANWLAAGGQEVTDEVNAEFR